MAKKETKKTTPPQKIPKDLEVKSKGKVLTEILREPAEVRYKEDLDYLKSLDKKKKKPFSWELSPQMVRSFILGSQKSDKLDKTIEQKWYGNPSIVERAIVTLASDRGLLLIGDPGTGKSWLAELLAAAISNKSIDVVQGTAGTTEDQIKYSWNIAKVIAEGQSRDSLIPSPIMSSMQAGALGRFEELTRCTSDVQDALISIMSEKCISIPELKKNNVVFAKPGFNIIATANSRDRGVNDLSSALKRRFNFVHIPIIVDKKIEKEIVTFRTKDLLKRHDFDVTIPPTLLEILIQTFSDLREVNSSATANDQKLESALSTAEQIGILEDAILHSVYFGSVTLEPSTLGRSMVSTIVRRLPEDISILNKFWHNHIQKYEKMNSDWEQFLKGGKKAMVSIK